MTNKEAIETIKYAKLNCPADFAIAFDIAIKALEKQEPKFVKCPKGWRGTRYTKYYCPNCNRTLKMNENWCNNCGQHIKQPKRKLVDNSYYELDWSEE